LVKIIIQVKIILSSNPSIKFDNKELLHSFQ
jgi:hypothetical protein